MVELAWLCKVEKPLPGSIMAGVGSRMLSGDRERVDSKWSILDVVLLLLLVKMGYSSSDTRFVAADCVYFTRVRSCPQTVAIMLLSYLYLIGCCATGMEAWLLYIYTCRNVSRMLGQISTTYSH